MTLQPDFASFLHLPKKTVARGIVGAALLLIILFGINRWTANGAWRFFPAKPPQVNFNMSLQMAYYSQDNDWDSTIVLNNNAKEERFVQVTLYGKDGQPLNVPIFSIPANSIRRFKLSDWTLGANNFREGNISVATHGKPMEITGQVSIVNRRDRLEFESKPSMTTEYSSQRLNGIVTVPDRQAKAYIALTNTSAAPIDVSLTSDSEHVHADKVKLLPHETKVEEIKLKNSNNSPLSALVTLQHNGSVGALITTAYAANKQTGFTANLYFYDDAKTVSNKLAGAHFRFGEANPAEGFPAGTIFKAPLVLANLGNATSTATVTVDYTQNGQAKTQSIGSFTLAPRAVKEIELHSALATFGVTGAVENAGVDIKYSGTAGTLVGQLTSMSTNGDYSFDVPVKDPLAGMNRNTGSYPFRLDGGYNTVLHLKNTTDKVVYAAVQIRYEGGDYNPNQIKLEPFQTVAVDIKRFQTSQAADIRKKTFPSNVTSGKIIWYERTGGSLTGRAETADFSAGIAGSFSCGGSCSCGMQTTSAFMDPYSLLSQVGDHGYPFTPMESLEDCNGDYDYGPYPITSGLTWSSSNTSIATVGYYSGDVECMSAGTCDINFTYTAVYDYDGGYSCNPAYNNFYGSGSITVISLAIFKGTQNVTNGSMDVIVGQRVSLEVRPDPAVYNLSNIQWTVPGTRVADYAPTVSTGIPTDLTVLNQNTVNYYWVDGGNNRQVSVSANIGGKTFTARTNFNVKRPIVQNIDTTTGGIYADSDYFQSGTWLHFGNPNTTPGIKFTATVQKPSGFSGSLAWVQIAHPLHRRRQGSILGGWEKLDETGLDSTFPYAGPFSENTVSTDDSPGSLLSSSYQQFQAADRFSMWLIFKPSGNDAIWVPLSRVDWGWNGVATRSGSTWSLASSSLENISVTDDLSFPRWTREINLANWVND